MKRLTVYVTDQAEDGGNFGRLVAVVDGGIDGFLYEVEFASHLQVLWDALMRIEGVRGETP